MWLTWLLPYCQLFIFLIFQLSKLAEMRLKKRVDFSGKVTKSKYCRLSRHTHTHTRLHCVCMYVSQPVSLYRTAACLCIVSTWKCTGWMASIFVTLFTFLMATTYILDIVTVLLSQLQPLSFCYSFSFLADASLYLWQCFTFTFLADSASLDVLAAVETGPPLQASLV